MRDAIATPSYLWQVPGKRVSVKVSLNLVDHLGDAVMEGFQSLPRRGLETGGLLLGRVRRNGETIVVEVDSFEALACEHAVGPSYLLSAFDRRVLEERIRRLKSSGGPSVVGFYRGNTRKDFALTMEDVDLMSEYFSEPSNVFLLIHARSDGPPTAGFAIWEGRKIRSMKPYLEFPFHETGLMTGAHQICAPARMSPAEREPAAETRPSPAFRQMERRWPDTVRLLKGLRLKMEWIAAAVVIITGLLGAILSRGISPAAATVPLGLRAAHEGNGVRLLWDRSAPVVRTATRAVLWIGDGPAQNKLNMDPKQLTGGSIVYWPRSRNVTFRMEIFAPNMFGSESVATATAAMNQTPPEPPPLPDVSPPLLKVAGTATPAPALATAEPMTEKGQISAPPRSLSQKRSYGARASSTVRGPTVPAASHPAAVASLKMPLIAEPPEIAASLVSPPEAILFRESELLKSRTPEIADAFVSVRVDRLPDPGGPKLLGKLIGKRRKRTDFVPPTPVHEAPTNVPAELRHRTKHEVPVDVKLYVDRAGKVEYAELLSKGTGPDRDLASLAVFASRRWQFAPARLGDESVPAEVVLRFRFGPEVQR